MASTFKALNYADPMPSAPMVNVALMREFRYDLSAALVINDLIKLCPIKAVLPKVLDDFYIDVPDLDSSGTPAVVLDLGDNDDDDHFVLGSTKGQAAAIITAAVDGVKGRLPKLYTANNDFVLHVDTAPATGATSGTIRGWMQYHHVGIASVL